MKEYLCEGLTVQWRPEKCTHARECVKGLPQVFSHEKRPWINMQGASPEEIMKVIDRCPSGALTYKLDTPGAMEEMPSDESHARITVTKNGPLLVEGECILFNSERKEEAKCGPYALCRCGSSRNKPFCDGTHVDIKFDDAK